MGCAKPMYRELVEAIRQSAAVYADGTGWRIGVLSAWLWVFTSQRVTVYTTGDRSHEVVVDILGRRFRGVLVSDCFTAYDAQALEGWLKRKCFAHILREGSRLEREKTRGAVRFPRELLPSGRGLIRISTFSRDSGHDLVAEFDTALGTLMDAPGLIIDLRGKGVGGTALAERMAGRFLSEAFVYGREHYRGRLPQRGWQLHLDYRVTPRAPVYPGPLVLLGDELTMSTAEQFLVALVDSGRALLVGRRTAGSSGNPVKFRLPGEGVARFSTGDFRRVDGTSIEGVGLVPHVPVVYTVEDFRTGHDPDLEAAQELLLAQGAPGKFGEATR